MKIGFIGCGNMASAMIGGIIKNQVVAPADILASAKTEVSREKKKEETFRVKPEEIEKIFVAEESDYGGFRHI